ncbi:MAG: hypothetical protein II309_01825, partial [Bacilli bacterium]|nr:hypothetical protein [Bacilli bacterium]
MVKIVPIIIGLLENNPISLTSFLSDLITCANNNSIKDNTRPSRNLQTFFVNGRPVKSRLMIAALEEAYRNQIMAGKFPACVLYLTVPAHTVDVNVHPAKTEVK